MKNRTAMLAESAILSALSLALIYLSGITPTMSLALVAVAGLLPAAPVIRYRTEAGFMTYAAASLLALLLTPHSAVAYVLFFGHYPMVKSYIERIGKRFWEWILKLAVFFICLTVFILAFKTLFEAELPGASVVLGYLGGGAAFVIYDIGFTRLITVFSKRLKKQG